MAALVEALSLEYPEFVTALVSWLNFDCIQYIIAP
jgi:hypothetical protein